MRMPSKKEVDRCLLAELEKAGGSAKPSELYDRMAAHFPQFRLISDEPGGDSRWRKCVQWARVRLIHKGELDGSVRGVWAITEAGQRTLRSLPEGLTQPPTKAKRARKKVRAIVQLSQTDHDKIGEALRKIGEAFGFDTLWKPKVNLLRPKARSLESKRKTLDIAWGIANLTWVPIEVQVKGSVPDLMYRFHQVHQWSCRLVVVTVPAYENEIKEIVKEYPFSDKVVVLKPKQVLQATRSLDRLLQLKKAIFE